MGGEHNKNPGGGKIEAINPNLKIQKKSVKKKSVATTQKEKT